MSGIRMQLGGRLCCGIKAGTRRLLKRWFVKHRRQAEKRNPDQPTKRAQYKGWYD